MSESVVVPCYNEEHRLDRDAYLEFAWRKPGCRILFVDDGSGDGTREVLESLAEAVPEAFQVLALPQNRGKAEAVRQGMRHCIDRGDRLIGYWDADLATPLRLIPEFLTVLADRDRFDVVLGTRLPLLGREVRRDLWRGFLGRRFAGLASLSLGFPVRDTQCGAKVFRTTPQLQASLQAPFQSRWIFDVELLHRLRIACGENPSGFSQRIFELPLAEWREVGGSRLKWVDYLRAPWELASLTWSCRMVSRPAAARIMDDAPPLNESRPESRRHRA